MKTVIEATNLGEAHFALFHILAFMCMLFYIRICHSPRKNNFCLKLVGFAFFCLLIANLFCATSMKLQIFVPWRL